MDRSNLLSPKRAIEIQKSKVKIQQQFLSFKDDSTFLSLNDEERQNYIDQKVDEQISLLNEISIKSADNLGKLEWLDDQNESIIVHFKNKPLFMGRTVNAKIYLTNEETLFLIESNSVICFYKSLQLSLQDAFSLMIKNEFEFDRYMVYSYLLRFGYRVKRFEGSLIENELRTDLQIQVDDELRTDSKCEFKNNLKEEQSNDKMEQSNDKMEQFNDEEEQSMDEEEQSMDKMEDDYVSSIKRSINDSDEQQQLKKMKKSTILDKNQTKINLVPLNQLVNCDTDPTNELDFLKFIRFKKLNKTDQHNNWQDLKDDYMRFKLNDDTDFYKSAFLIEEEMMINLDNLNESRNDAKYNQFYNDFLNDNAPLISLNESLTYEQIQQRLTEYGPQLDLLDYSSNDINQSNSEQSQSNQRQSTTYDYNVYLPNKKQKISSKPDYYLKILHSSKYLNFPFSEIFELNSRIEDRKKLLFVHCQSNEPHFYQFTDVDLVNF